MDNRPEKWDVVVYVKHATFPMGGDTEYEGVVNGVTEIEGDVMVDIDGVEELVPLDDIQKIRHKSPSMPENER